MNYPNIKIRKVFVVVVCLASNLAVNANNIDKSDFPRVNLSAETVSIKVGEPFVFKLSYEYEKPRIVLKTNKALSHVKHGAIVQIWDSNGKILIPRYPVHPSHLYNQDEEGLEYSNNFILFYNHYYPEKKLLFDKSRTYKITLLGQEILEDKAPNPLIVIVNPASDLEKKTLSLLSDPNDYAFLEFGMHEFKERRSERMSQLKKVVEQCEGTVLAEWAAARLGVEYFKDFQEKYQSLQKFKALRKKKKVKEPLFERASKYLSIGAKLPDEFPIREDLLRQLMRIEYVNGDYAEAISILDEMGTKYPKGKYGRNATKMEEGLLEAKKRELK